MKKWLIKYGPIILVVIGVIMKLCEFYPGIGSDLIISGISFEIGRKIERSI